MKPASELPENAPTTEPSLKRAFLGWPVTRLGWLAVILAGIFILLFIINITVFMQSNKEIPAGASWKGILLPLYGLTIILSGLASGILGLLALVRKQERSGLVWIAVLPGLFILFLLLGEVLFPH